jgi:hypothetical protein
MKYVSKLTFLALTFSCCGILYDKYGREPLIMTRENYNGSQLKINGMYLNQRGNHLGRLFFYNNGVIINGFCFDFDYRNSQKSEEYFKSIAGKSPCNDIVYAWGLYQIKGNDITIETWLSGEIFDKYRTKTSYGKILNDTTFYVDKYYTKGFDTFRFISLPMKPDSTNRFIN